MARSLLLPLLAACVFVASVCWYASTGEAVATQDLPQPPPKKRQLLEHLDASTDGVLKGKVILVGQPPPMASFKEVMASTGTRPSAWPARNSRPSCRPGRWATTSRLPTS